MERVPPSQFVLFDAVSAVVVVLDRTGRIAHWNQAAAELTGYTLEEVRGRFFWDVVLRSGDVAPVKDVFFDLTVSTLPNRFENVWVAKSGQEYWLAWSNSVTTDEHGQVEHVISTGVDRTDAQRAEERRRVSEAKLDAIVSIAADAIISIEEDQTIVRFNRGAEEIFGWAAEEVLGKPLTLLLPERFADSHQGHIEAFSREPDPARRMAERVPEILGVRKSGEEFPAEAAISKVYLDGSWLFSVILRDISERKLVETTLRDAVAARDRLLGAVAHDLRNPLNAIRLHATRLSRGTRDRDRGAPHPAVAEIEQEAGRMTRLIDDLLDYARLESGSISLSLEEVQPTDIAAVSVHSMRALAQASNLSISADIPDTLPAIRADSDRLRQVFDNLLSNAVKFSFEGGTITVRAESRGKEVAFSVIDEGPGIPEEHHGRLFEPFWQGEAAGRRGAGLGLTICKQVVEAHGGRIEVDGHSAGSAFTFTLPRVQDGAG